MKTFFARTMKTLAILAMVVTGNLSVSADELTNQLTVEATLGTSVSDVTLGNSEIYADGSGVVFPTTSSIQGVNDNWFEVSCEGESIISFDWTGAMNVDETSGWWYCFVKCQFEIDGQNVNSKSLEWGRYANNSASGSVKAFLTPGTHKLRWSVSNIYRYNVQFRIAVENFKVEEKPVAKRETLFDWGLLLYYYRVWKPDNLTAIRDRYTQKIEQNGLDYESRIWRGLTQIALLGENAKARQVIGQFGCQFADYTLRPTGAFVGCENAPLPNTVVDEVTPEIVTAIDSALEDVRAIPTNWSGRIEIKPEDYGFSIPTNEVWTDEKVYIGLAEVSALQGTLETMRAFVKLAQGYDYEADYLAVTNALQKRDFEWLSDAMAVVPKVGLVRNLAAMTEAKEDFRAALESVKRADAAILNRGDYDTYLLEYDVADSADLDECREIRNQVAASLDATNVIDMTYFVGKYDTNGKARAQIPGGETMRQLFLGALFAGKVTRTLAPEAYVNKSEDERVCWAQMQALPDATFGGFLPDFTITDWAEIYPYNQEWEMSAYLACQPKLKLKSGKSLAVSCTATRTSDLSYEVLAPGSSYCLHDWAEFVDGSYATQGSDTTTIVATNGEPYEIFFTADGDMDTATQPLSFGSTPLPLPDGGPYTESSEGVEITFEIVDGKAWLGTSSNEAINNSTAGNVTIPATLGGRPVVGIRQFAFFRCSKLSNLIFMGDEPTVEANAFYQTSLNSVLVTRSASWPNPLPSTWQGFSIGYISALDASMVVTPSRKTGDFTFSTTLALGAGANQTIYYTTDGSEPSRASSVYGGPLVITQTTTVRYFAVDDSTGDWGPVGKVVLTRVAAESDTILVTPSVADGTRFLESQSVELSATEGQTIWYTTDGSDPSASWTRKRYDGPIAMGTNTTLKYYAVDDATGDWSAVRTATYYRRLPDGGPYVEVVDGIEWRFYITNGVSYFKGPDCCVIPTWGTNAVPFDTCGAIVVPSELGYCPLMSIGSAAFGGCASLTSVTIPSGVTNVGANAFSGCTSLSNIDIPDGVVSIGYYAFSSCSSLSKLRLPRGMRCLSGNLLMGSSITHLIVPDTVTNINPSAVLSSSTFPTTSTARQKLQYLIMEGDAPEVRDSTLPSLVVCSEFDSSLTATAYVRKGSRGYGTVPGTWAGIPVKYFDDAVFTESVDGWAWNYRTDGTSATLQQRSELLLADTVRGSLALPETVDGHPVTILGKSLLQGATEMTNVTIPATVTALEGSVFRECTHLTHIDLPAGLCSIGDNAFRECASLTEVTIPASVTNIGYFAFRDCLRLTNVTLLGTAPRQDLGVYMGVPAFTIVSGRMGAATAIVYAGITNKTDEITVPENWLDEIATIHDTPAGKSSYQQAFTERFGSDLKTALTRQTGKYDLHGNPLCVWQDYVAGTDPLDEEDTFTATVTMEDGVPVVRWEPELPPERAVLRKYTVYGATALNGRWDDVSDKSDQQRHDLGYQFFSVTVEMK